MPGTLRIAFVRQDLTRRSHAIIATFATNDSPDHGRVASRAGASLAASFVSGWASRVHEPGRLFPSSGVLSDGTYPPRLPGCGSGRQLGPSPTIPPSPVKLLVITGDNVKSHDWKDHHAGVARPALGQGRINVDVTTTPADDLTDENLAKYDVSS